MRQVTHAAISHSKYTPVSMIVVQIGAKSRARAPPRQPQRNSIREPHAILRTVPPHCPPPRVYSMSGSGYRSLTGSCVQDESRISTSRSVLHSDQTPANAAVAASSCRVNRTSLWSSSASSLTQMNAVPPLLWCPILYLD
ncbi:hypothetical protein AOLI_G00184150 [Acnodon oligacanthus]